MLEIDVIKVYDDSQIGLRITSEEMDAENKLMVTLIGQKAEESWHNLAPLGETGNLRSSFKAFREATPLRDVPTGQFITGNSYESVARIRTEGFHGFSRKTQPNETDPPIEYALAIDEGRQALSAPTSRSGKGAFAWTTGNAIHANRNTAKTRTGKNVVRRRLRARPGTHFIDLVHIETDEYARRKVNEWMRVKGKLSAEQLASIRLQAGIFRGNPFEAFGPSRRIISPFD